MLSCILFGGKWSIVEKLPINGNSFLVGNVFLTALTEPQHTNQLITDNDNGLSAQHE